MFTCRGLSSIKLYQIQMSLSMAIAWESKVPEIVEKAGLLPRPGV
jgi:hypothetical protein